MNIKVVKLSPSGLLHGVAGDADKTLCGRPLGEAQALTIEEAAGVEVRGECSVCGRAAEGRT
jgi:hypothetical protein